MNDETLNTDIRRFLKKVGIQSQQEIERAVQAAMASGQLQGNEHIDAVMRLQVRDLDLDVQIRGDIALE